MVLIKNYLESLLKKWEVEISKFCDKSWKRFIILLPRTPGNLIQVVTDRINRHLGNVLTSEDLVHKVKIETWYYDGESSIDDMRNRIIERMEDKLEIQAE